MLAQIALVIGVLAGKPWNVGEHLRTVAAPGPPVQVTRDSDVRAVPGLDLWEGARFGMTVAQVQEAFPDAQPNRPSPRSLNNLGESPLLVLRREVGPGDVYVEFLFKDGHLGTVGRVYGGGKTAHSYTKTEIRSLIGKEAQRFGAAGVCKPNPPNGTDCIWIKAGVAVGAFAAYGRPMLYVITGPERPEDTTLLKQLEAR